MYPCNPRTKPGVNEMIYMMKTGNLGMQEKFSLAEGMELGQDWSTPEPSPPTPLTPALWQLLEEVILSPQSGQRQKGALGSGVLPAPILVLLGPRATGQSRSL